MGRVTGFIKWICNYYFFWNEFWNTGFNCHFSWVAFLHLENIKQIWILSMCRVVDKSQIACKDQYCCWFMGNELESHTNSLVLKDVVFQKRWGLGWWVFLHSDVGPKFCFSSPLCCTYLSSDAASLGKPDGAALIHGSRRNRPYFPEGDYGESYCEVTCQGIKGSFVKLPNLFCIYFYRVPFRCYCFRTWLIVPQAELAKTVMPAI